MSTSLVFKCRSCGQSIEYTEQDNSKECPACHVVQPVPKFEAIKDTPPQEKAEAINSLRKLSADHPEDSEIHFTLGLYYLANGGYSFAENEFLKAVEIDPHDAEPLYYLCVSMLGGKKPYVTPRATIDKIVEYIKTAENIEPKAKYYYLHSYVAFDYFKRRCLTADPRYDALLSNAKMFGITSKEKDEIFNMLKTPKPNELN